LYNDDIELVQIYFSQGLTTYVLHPGLAGTCRQWILGHIFMGPATLSLEYLQLQLWVFIRLTRVISH